LTALAGAPTKSKDKVLAAIQAMEETMSVYRVTEVIGTSSIGWAEAAKEAIQTAALSLRDLRVAEVVSQDMTISEHGAIESYRTKLRLSFKYERPIGAPGWENKEAPAQVKA
jgi:hypothetical protein